MERRLTKSFFRKRLVFGFVGLLLAGAGLASYLYFHLRMIDLPPAPASVRPQLRATARVMMAPRSPADWRTAAPSEPSPPSNTRPPQPGFHIERDPLDEFRGGLKDLVLVELAPTFPELQPVLDEQEQNGSSPQDRRVLFQLLGAVKTAPDERRPAILFAADLVASHLGCDDRSARDAANSECARLKTDLARYDLTLKYDQLGAGSYYQRDLLWRIWAQYPQAAWGERAFVLLLDRGWDTSYTCEKGGDQTRQVIHQGESFLGQRPNSAYRAVVTLLVAEAYASWWSLSNETPGSDMSDYVDPKQFQQGADAARLKAIAYFQEVSRLAPDSSLDKFSLQALPPLHNKQVLDNYRFFCVYD